MSLDLNIQSIILLLYFIAPGFVFTRTYMAYRPRYYREPTAFEQFVLAIIGSTIIHAAALTIVAMIVLVFWSIIGQLIDTSNIFDPTVPISNYPLSDLALFLFFGVIYLAVSLVLARRFGSFLGRGTPADRPRWWNFLLGKDPPEPFILWHTVLQIEPLRLNLIPPHLTIQMRNGECFEGDLYRMRLVGDEDNTVELALRNVFQRVPGDPSSPEMKPLTNQIVLLRSTDILWLTRNDIPQ